MPKTISYTYRLRGVDQRISFRLDIGSNPDLLLQHHLKKHKGKKTPAIRAIIKLAKERIGQPRIKDHTFMEIIKKEAGHSNQKKADRIFQLALERYHEIIKEGSGRMPILLPKRIVAPSPRPKPRLTPRPASQATETEQPTETQDQKIARPQHSNIITTKLDKVKAMIPNDLHDHVKIEYNTKAQTFIMTIIKRIPTERFNEIAKISKKYRGTYVQWGGKDKPAYFIIPIENI